MEFVFVHDGSLRIDVQSRHVTCVKMVSVDDALPVIVAFHNAPDAVLRLCADFPVRIMTVHLAVSELICDDDVAAAERAASLDGPVFVAVDFVVHQEAPFIGGVQRIIRCERDDFAGVIAARLIGDGSQLFSVRQEAVIAKQIMVQHDDAKYQHRSGCRRQIPMLQNSAESLVEHHSADPECQECAQDHTDDQTDFTHEGQLDDNAQECAAQQRKHKAHDVMQRRKGQRMLGAFRPADTIKRKAQKQRQHNRSHAGQPHKLLRLVESLVEGIRGRSVQQRIGEAELDQRVQIPAAQPIPKCSQRLRADNQHAAGKQRSPVRSGEHAGQHTHRKAIEIDEQQHAELGQQRTPGEVFKHAVCGRDQKIQREIDHNGRKAQSDIADAAAQEIRFPFVGQRGMQHALFSAELMPHEHQRRQESKSAIEDDHQLQIQRTGHYVAGYGPRESFSKSARRKILRIDGLQAGNMRKTPEGQHVERDQKDDHADKQIAPEKETGGTVFISAHIRDPPFPR